MLDACDGPLPSAGYRSLVVNDNCLSRSSTAARGKLWQELHSRYRLDGTDPLFEAFWIQWQRTTSDSERALTAYALFALNDRLVADLGTQWLCPLLRRAPADLRVEDVRLFIERAAKQHPEVGRWSKETLIAVAQKYCASIRDFGLARGVVKKTTLRPALYGSPTRLLIRGLRLAGVPTLGLIQSPVFRLLAIDSAEVIDVLGELNRTGALRFRMQGDVVELEIDGPQ